MPEAPDPFQQWQQYRDQMLDIWARNMAEYVGTEAFAKSLGDYLDASLRTSGPFKDAFDRWAQASLAALNMPSRQEVLGIAERLAALELRLDDLEYAISSAPAAPAQDAAIRDDLRSIRAQLDELAALLRAAQPAPGAAAPSPGPQRAAAATADDRPAARSRSRSSKESKA